MRLEERGISICQIYVENTTSVNIWPVRNRGMSNLNFTVDSSEYLRIESLLLETNNYTQGGAFRRCLFFIKKTKIVEIVSPRDVQKYMDEVNMFFYECDNVSLVLSTR